MAGSLVQDVANAASNRWNQRQLTLNELAKTDALISLEKDKMKLEQFGMLKQDQANRRQAGSALMNAAVQGEASMMNAGMDYMKMQQQDRQFNSELASSNYFRGLEADRLGRATNIAERQDARAEQEFAYKIDALQTASELDKIKLGTALMEEEMAKAIHSGNMERVPQYFALRDALAESSLSGYKAEDSLRKWSVVGRYASGINSAIAEGRVDIAKSLYNSLMQEAKDNKIDLSRYGLPQGAAFDMTDKQKWSMLNDIAVNSLDFQQKALLANIQNGSSTASTYLNLMKMFQSANKDANAESGATADAFRENFTLPAATQMGIEVVGGGYGSPDDPNLAGALESYNNFLTTHLLGGANNRSAVLDPRNKQLAQALTSRLKIASPTFTFWPEDLESGMRDKYFIPQVGMLRDPRNPNKALFQDGEKELEAVGDNELFQRQVVPAMEALKGILQQQGNTNAAALINEGLGNMLQANSVGERLANYEELAQYFTLLQIQGR